MCRQRGYIFSATPAVAMSLPDHSQQVRRHNPPQRLRPAAHHAPRHSRAVFWCSVQVAAKSKFLSGVAYSPPPLWLSRPPPLHHSLSLQSILQNADPITNTRVAYCTKGVDCSSRLGVSSWKRWKLISRPKWSLTTVLSAHRRSTTSDVIEARPHTKA